MHKLKCVMGGFVAAVVLGLAVPLLALASGLIDMSASAAPGLFESTLAPWALDRSVAAHAPTVTNPFAQEADALDVGLDHYRENCVICHGAPRVEPGELAEGLNPPVPRLHENGTQAMSDGDLFWIVKNGVRMTGMPAFGGTHTDEEIWKIVAFIRHLPSLTPGETAALAEVTEEEAHHHEEPRETTSDAATTAMPNP